MRSFLLILLVLAFALFIAAGFASLYVGGSLAYLGYKEGRWIPSKDVILVALTSLIQPLISKLNPNWIIKLSSYTYSDPGVMVFGVILGLIGAFIFAFPAWISLKLGFKVSSKFKETPNVLYGLLFFGITLTVLCILGLFDFKLLFLTGCLVKLKFIPSFLYQIVGFFAAAVIVGVLAVLGIKIIPLNEYVDSVLNKIFRKPQPAMVSAV